MRVLFHVTMPPSPMAACDAVIQEIEAIRAGVPGDICHLYPAHRPGTRFPRRLWGLQHLPQIKREERHIDLHHVFNPDPYAFEVLRTLRRPILYTAVAGVRGAHQNAALRLAGRVHTLVVPAATDLERLRAWRIDNAVVVKPGIDTSRFSYAPVPKGTSPTLLMGSAPWTEEQFRTKGVDVLLELARQRHDLHLIFLWRGVLEDQMRRRVAAASLQDRVEVLTEQVDVNRVLARVHASVVLAADDTLVKSYPHSLLESLAAGKPVLVSRLIPFADEVEQSRCGVVVGELNLTGVARAVDRLFANYEGYCAVALQTGQSAFNQQHMVAAYEKLYHAVVRISA